jgi:hypothetical protein
MSLNVIKGPAAVEFGGGWLGVASGNVTCKYIRLTQEEAYEEAKALETDLELKKDE